MVEGQGAWPNAPWPGASICSALEAAGSASESAHNGDGGEPNPFLLFVDLAADLAALNLLLPALDEG